MLNQECKWHERGCLAIVGEGAAGFPALTGVSGLTAPQTGVFFVLIDSCLRTGSLIGHKLCHLPVMRHMALEKSARSYTSSAISCMDEAHTSFKRVLEVKRIQQQHVVPAAATPNQATYALNTGTKTLTLCPLIQYGLIVASGTVFV